MPEHKRLKIAELVPDPILPPRINDPERLDTLKQSMRDAGLLQPIAVRPPVAEKDDPSPYRIAAGCRRWVCAASLGWDVIDVIVRRDLTDEEVLLLAYRADEESQPRSRLETAWYYASLKDAGMLQMAIAAQEDVSEARVSMYVKVGEVLAPKRIKGAGVALEDAATLPITLLSEIAKAPDNEVDNRLKSAIAREDEGEETQERPSFEWSQSAKGTWKAIAREPDLESWSAAERRELIDNVGPLVSTARELEDLESPEALKARQDALEVGRREVLRLREEHASQVVELTDRLARLARERTEATANADRSPVHAMTMLTGLAMLRRTAGHSFSIARTWLCSSPIARFLGSIFGVGGSTVEEQLKIEFERDY